MTLDAFLYAVIAVFLAELGDKTMLATIFLSAQYRQPWMVLLAAMLALTAATIIAIMIGLILASTLPLRLIFYLAGFIFLLMGIYTLATSTQIEKVDETSPKSMVGMFSVVFLAELGDKLAAYTSIMWIKRTSGLFFIIFGLLSLFGILN
jgi:putative Ca2+/H+ antiporter (TMEM165/GDT1 family)